MTDLVERLRAINLPYYREAATALEAKDKELAALKEERFKLITDLANMKDRSLKAEARAETAERVFEDTLDELGCERNNEAALQAIAVLKARVAALRDRAETAEQRLKSRDTCQDAAFAKLLDRKDELAKLLATAVRERDRIADELDAMNNNHRLMAKLLADTGRERDEARAAINTIDKIVHTPTSGNEKAQRHFQRDFDAIRKLAAPFRAARAITGEDLGK